jgi:hypothetical protein
VFGRQMLVMYLRPKPTRPDALTVADESRFLDLLGRERNLPAGLAADIQQCY